ncbi:Clp family protein [Streptomyces sp. NBRC 110611]|uniref:hypothetical protein n=1 Tax=Streptomyces sp. NBRC 110611 TaxID=1621259 RepID=UPI00082E26ED|nr:hypothetical protein [Streptomyces sp. NBRC 110611]GAU71409.1 Clp family protein [Streptomyces sp. NBRC 110611]
MHETVPNWASFTRARQRLGPEGLSGAFWCGMRLAAVDGWVLDAPDSPANRAFFGGPAGARTASAGFPQVGW